MPRTSPASQSAPRDAVRRGVVAFAAFALASLGFAVGTSPAFAHDVLSGQAVVTDSSDTVTGISLSFNNEVIEVGSEINITGADGTLVSDGAPQVSGREVVQPVTHPLEKGDYAVDWRVVSSDGHPIEGAMTLAIDAEGAGELLVSEETDGHHGEDGDDATDEQDGTGANSSDDGIDGEMHTMEQNDDAGLDPLVTTLIIVAAAIVAAGAIAAVVVGSRRRRAAIDDAAASTRPDAE